MDNRTIVDVSSEEAEAIQHGKVFKRSGAASGPIVMSHETAFDPISISPEAQGKRELVITENSTSTRAELFYVSQRTGQAVQFKQLYQDIRGREFKGYSQKKDKPCRPCPNEKPTYVRCNPGS